MHGSAVAALLAAIAGATMPRPAVGAAPHIVLILADDYGWAHLGVHRRDAGASKQALGEVQTPNMDALIAQGVLLDHHYAYKICSPSRSSLQSGRLAVHVNSVNAGVTVANASDPVSGFAGIPRNMTGMAQKLRQAGYRTHAVGKWDAGMATPQHTPLGRGYESWLGYFQHANDYWRVNTPFEATGEVDSCLNSFADFFKHNDTYCGGARDGAVAAPECLADPQSHPQCYEEQLFKDRALEIINGHDTSAPLFLFYSFHLLHTPLQVPASYLDKIDDLVVAAGGKKIDSQNRRLYAAMTYWMDEAIGEVVQALKAKGMWDNALLVFTSDNGGPIYEPGAANNHPLKGGKYSDWQGGVRVNAWISGGFVPPERRGKRHGGVVSIADWYGTFCELAGVDAHDSAAEEANKWLAPRGLPLLPPVDSVAQWGFILNGTNGRPQLQLSSQALLQWPYKLVVGKQVYSAWPGELYPNCSTIAGMEEDKGPVFVDVKVFDHSVYLSDDPEMQDKMSWTQDCGSGCLMNVEQDPTEHIDLARDAEHADVLARMQKDLEELNKGGFNPRRGTSQMAACDRGIANGGYYGPFVDVEGFYTEAARTPGEAQIGRMLHQELKVVSREIVERGLAEAAQALVPAIRQHWMSTLDKCLATDAEHVIV